MAVLAVLVAAAAFSAPAAAASDDVFLMIYIIGVDLEDKGSAATANLVDLLRTWDPESGEFLVFYGSAEKTGWNPGTAVADYVTLADDFLADGKIGSDNGTVTSSVLARLPSPTGSKAGLEDAVRYANTYAKEHGLSDAHRYLILWDHGGGYSGIGNKGHNISNDEIGQALSLTDKKFDIIIYDACHMASLEAAYTVKNYGYYMLASEETEPSSGLDYTGISQALSPSASKNPVDIASVIIDRYLADGDASKTDSLIDLSKIDNVVYSIDKVGGSLKNLVTDSDAQEALGYIYSNTEKFSGDDEDIMDLYDFSWLLNSIAEGSIKDNAVNLMNAVEQCVIIAKSNSGHDYANGLAIANVAKFYPEDVGSRMTLSNGGWSEFIKGYATLLNSEYDAEYTYSADTGAGGYTQEASVKSVSPGTLVIKNDHGQSEVYVDHLYRIGDKFYIVGQEKAEQGLKETEGNANWAFLPDGEYKTGDDWECNAFVLKNKDKTVLVTPLYLDEVKLENGDVQTVYTINGEMTRTIDGKDVTYQSYLTAYVNDKTGEVYDLTVNSETEGSDSTPRLNLWGSEEIKKGDRFTPLLDYMSDESEYILSEMSDKSFAFSDNPINDLVLIDLDEDNCYWDYEITSISSTEDEVPTSLSVLDFAANDTVTIAHNTGFPTAAPKSCAPLAAVLAGLVAACVVLRRV